MERSVLNGMTPSNSFPYGSGIYVGKKGERFFQWVTPRKQFLPDIANAHTNSKRLGHHAQGLHRFPALRAGSGHKLPPLIKKNL